MVENLWNPEQYKKFENERNQPFYDLIELIQPYPEMHILDVGCGTGNLTLELHKKLNASNTLGIDSSSEMLSKAFLLKESNLHFKKMDIQNFFSEEKFDLIVSNACLQWVPGHLLLFKKLTELLSERGQLAIHVPYNQDYATHVIANDLAKEFGIISAKFNVLLPEVYVQMLYDLGFKNQMVRMQIYAHKMESIDAIVEWLKGSLFTYYQTQLSEKLFQEYVAEYKTRLTACLGKTEPILMPFKRLFIFGKR